MTAKPKKDKTAKKKPAGKPDYHGERQLRHIFTEKETIEIAKKMAEASRDLNQAEEEKKAVTSTLKAKVDGIQARVNEHAGKINSGFEYRTTPITTKFHTPKTGQKQTIRDDTGEIIEIDQMSMAEMQDELPLGSVEPFNPAINEDAEKRIKASPGVVPCEADGDAKDLVE